ncbi:hypothetical protein [Ochrobactrum sp. Marseille-Q0166]|uniref:hypothetical protein n=1 Tax=Ochrobactrum sp. Marseille-Q0166 TaxID=2761105 RepID=UPI0016554380|nr:hypothetical protein [Ochrobactrum sp. Marseille-Q0166]MBC8718757.1 hypothetical protein [Ochrobactrum sp. Marseille-Q0166]
MEVSRILAELAEIDADTEIQTIDMLRSFGSEEALNAKQCIDYRLGRRDDYSGLTVTALENMQTAVLEAAE